MSCACNSYRTISEIKKFIFLQRLRERAAQENGPSRNTKKLRRRGCYFPGSKVRNLIQNVRNNALQILPFSKKYMNIAIISTWNRYCRWTKELAPANRCICGGLLQVETQRMLYFVSPGVI